MENDDIIYKLNREGVSRIATARCSDLAWFQPVVQASEPTCRGLVSASATVGDAVRLLWLRGVREASDDRDRSYGVRASIVSRLCPVASVGV